MKVELSILEIRVIVEAIQFLLTSYGEEGALQYLGSRKKLKAMKEVREALADVHAQ